MGEVALTKEQVEQLKELFLKFDRDGDGSINELEMGALMRSIGLKPNAEQLSELILKADQNSNGLVEFPEFLALIGPDAGEEVSYNQEELLALFRKFDRDGNGYITAPELALSMAKLGHALSVRELTDMIREADTDEDGRISFAEFVAAMTNAASENFAPQPL